LKVFVANGFSIQANAEMVFIVFKLQLEEGEEFLAVALSPEGGKTLSGALIDNIVELEKKLGKEIKPWKPASNNHKEENCNTIYT
jgi:hypothetical protein